MASIVSKCGENLSLRTQDKRDVLERLLASIGGNPRKILILPPDITRFNSNAGELSAMLYEMLSPGAEVDFLPAIGTHAPMTEGEIRTMFGPVPLSRFHEHDWRDGVVHCGDIPGELIGEWSEGRVDYSVRIDLDKRLRAGYDLILSVGQIVPHEVVGMANYTKNVMVGVGGRDIINKSHFLGAVYNMERIMGRIDTPVRRLFNHAAATFLSDLPIYYIMSVMARNPQTGGLDMKGLVAGQDDETFAEGARLSQKVNLNLLDKPLKKVVVYLDPHEFKSTWLGNKAVYRTRMAIADGGELIVLAPGLKEFGEDKDIDRLIRKFGYCGTPATLKAVEENAELRENLSAAAHLVHGSSEDRFGIVYCPGPKLSQEDVRGVGFEAASLEQMMAKYNPAVLKDGYNDVAGEEVFYISNPALGLWALKEQFEGTGQL